MTKTIRLHVSVSLRRNGEIRTTSAELGDARYAGWTDKARAGKHGVVGCRDLRRPDIETGETCTGTGTREGVRGPIVVMKEL